MSSPSAVPLESVLCTEQLEQRPWRPPDYESENRALVLLAAALASTPQDILQILAETILDVLDSDSAGISLLADDGASFYWPAIAGVWQAHVGGGTPRDFGPCGDVLDQNAPLLFRHPEWRYTYLQLEAPPVEECLSVPFHVRGKAVGTIWALAHREQRKFDREDLRILSSMGMFASAAYQSAGRTGELREERQTRKDAAEVLRKINAELLVSSMRQHELTAQAQQAEHKMQASETHYRRLFETAKDGILIVDIQTRKVIDANPSIGHLLGRPVSSLVGRELCQIGVFADEESANSALGQLHQKGSLHYEHQQVECSFGSVDAEIVAAVHNEGEQSVIQFNIRDITDRSRLAALLREQAVELSELHRRKDEFLAMLSHELRNPLAPISHAVQILGLPESSYGPLQTSALRIIERQVSQLKHLVDDLLDVSRITTHRIQLRRERVLLSDVVQDSVEAVRPLLEARHHKLTVSLPADAIWLDGDPGRLEQVVVNLLTNAAKYTDEAGNIGLAVEHKPSADDGRGECTIRVSDTGVGISAALLPQVFELFTQSERSLARSQGGLGIGLALVRQLTKLHGGSVEAHSTLGEGSEFVVHLPTVAETSADVDSPEKKSILRAIRALRVLVVDDNEDTVLSISLLLRASGHEVRIAHDGRSAIDTALEYRPDAVLLDIGLPGLNGYEVARRIRQEPTLRNVVLVALTGYGQEADRRLAMESGFNHHLVKPARLDQLEKIWETVSA